MVLCKFFQQGSCRFGSKCANEHLDVKQMVKTDVEAALQLKQWPLSTYGPFRDKPSIPNFIEDQSFEEVRMLCYEAKQKNFFEQFHQQFTKEVLEATNKMNALLQMTPDVVDVIIKLYDTPADASSFGIAAGKPINNTASNPFGLANSNYDHTAKRGLATPNLGSSGLFSNTSIFAPQQQTSIFAQPSKSTNSIFGVNGNNNTQQNTSIFSQQQNTQNMFAASTQQQQQQQAANSNGLFSQQNQFMQPSQPGSNIFRQALQPSQPQQGLFAQASQTIQQQQVQAQQGLFSQAPQQASTGQSLFASATPQTQNIFAQAMQQQQQTNSNIFQQNQAFSAATQQQQANSNIFQQNQPTTHPQQNQAPQPPAGAFQQTALQMQNPAAQHNNQSYNASTLYSRLEDLTAEEIEAFKADCFLPGKIPFSPPPRELIN